MIVPQENIYEKLFFDVYVLAHSRVCRLRDPNVLPRVFAAS